MGHGAAIGPNEKRTSLFFFFFWLITNFSYWKGPTAKRATTAPLHPTLHFLFFSSNFLFCFSIGDGKRDTSGCFWGTSGCFWGTMSHATFSFWFSCFLLITYCYFFVFAGDGTRPTFGTLYPTLHIPSLFGASVGPYVSRPESTLFGRASRARESDCFKLSGVGQCGANVLLMCC